MNKSIYTIGLCFIIILFLIEAKHMYAQTEIPAGDVSGTWTKVNSPYHINGEITIPNDSTLTIEPGVEVVFTGYYKFNVQGRLLAVGTETDTIAFTINDTTGFHNPTIPDGGWGGMELEDISSSNDSTIFEYCNFQYGKSASGGAIYSEIDKLRISHCFFRNNMCSPGELFSGTGGAICIWEGNPVIEYCEFCLNKAHWNGSALSIWLSSDALIRNNHFHHNNSSAPIFIYHSASPTFINNLIEENHSNNGGILFLFFYNNANIKIINNTIVNNTCSQGAILVSNGNPIFINNIVYGNEPSQVYFDLPSSVSFYNNLIEGGREGFTGAAFTGAYENCIDADPLFVSSNDFHLQNKSNCIGEAIDSILVDGSWYYCPSIDYEGNPRPNPSGSMPDIGAYENPLAVPASTEIPEWITYNTSNSGLPTNSVHSIAIDGSRNKWIGTFGGGLTKFDGSSWTVYNTSNSGLPDNSVNCIALESNGNIWIGTGSFFTPISPDSGGLAKFDDTTWTVYNTGNSSLPSYEVRSIAIDGIGNKWIGTSNGLAKFDGINWTVYNTSNSGLPANLVLSLAIDESGNKWIGLHNYGLAKFDGINWTVYNTSNSGLPGNSVWSLAIDESGNKWIGTSEGLAKFDNTTWTVYNTSNSGLPANFVSFIVIDGMGNKWIGTNGGLAKFDNTNWTVYNTSNSGLPNNGIHSIAIDGNGNKWIGTGGGLALFNEGGIVPAELISFTATVNGKGVTLSWSTATELNNQGFEVQRKFGNSEFVTVGSVKGNGTTTSPNQYSYVDNLVDPGKYFYRLKQIDFNGTFEYSNEIEVEVRILDKFMLEQNYPNPFNPTTKIKYQLPSNVKGEMANVKLIIFDLLGSEVEELVNEKQKHGNYEVTWDASGYSSGVYFYKLSAGNSVETRKMILMK